MFKKSYEELNENEAVKQEKLLYRSRSHARKSPKPVKRCDKLPQGSNIDIKLQVHDYIPQAQFQHENDIHRTSSPQTRVNSIVQSSSCKQSAFDQACSAW